MAYGADFATADPAQAPLDPPLLIGADPFVWGAVLLALAVAAMIGWLVGSGARSRRGDAAGAIWKAVDDAAKAAMKADTDSLPARAADLRRVLRQRLGRALDFGHETGGRVEALAAILDDGGDGHGHGHGHDDGHGDDHHGHGPGDPHDAHGHDHSPAHAPEAAAAPASAAASVVVTVNHAAPAAAPAHPPHPRPDKRPMTARQRNDALRLAVAAFNDHWRHRAAREADLRAVLAELAGPDWR